MNYNELHKLLLISYNYSAKAIVKQTSQIGLMPGQPKILEFLLENDGCTQKEIGLGCALDKSTVTYLLHKMKEVDLIQKAPHKSDKRSSIILLTKKGREIALEVKKICCSVDQSAWKDIDEEDKIIFIQTLQKIIHNLKMEG